MGPAPGWSRFERLLRAGGSGSDQHIQLPLVEDARGFPLRSLSCTFSPKYTPRYARCIIDAIPLESSPQRSHQWLAERMLPTRPLWLGFAINSALYAQLGWAAIFGPSTLRRFIRRRRGLCPRCAYPIGASNVCTECGWAVGRVERATA